MRRITLQTTVTFTREVAADEYDELFERPYTDEDIIEAERHIYEDDPSVLKDDLDMLTYDVTVEII